MVGLFLAIALAINLSLAQTEPGGESFIRLAKETIAGKARTTSADHTPPKGVFVTIEVKGAIRGCRGTLEPRCSTLEEEIRNAASAASGHDPRYKTLKPEELKDFKVTVTLVDRLEPLGNPDDLQPKDGLVLRSGGHTGVVLPWEGKDPKIRLEWAYRKAGVENGAPATLLKLIGERYRG